ncbi:MAG: DUF1573 domain-containing protein [Bacteroidetes bacterium]|nr:MAG: DUF1573 domain-containing protein [Bacteroidota bacterium]
MSIYLRTIHRIITLTILCAFAFGFISPEKVTVEWLTPITHDFGDIQKEVPVFHEFKFKNIGSDPMLISNVRPACGCTATEWAETPILPDSTSTISIEFDARDEGYFKKLIKVYFQGQRKGYKLYIEGYVEI